MDVTKKTGVDWRWISSLTLCGILLFVYSLPHAMALRKALLLAVFLLAAGYVWRFFVRRPRGFMMVVGVLAILQLWMFYIAGVVADDTIPSFREWIGQWLPVLLSFAIGIGIAHRAETGGQENSRSTVALLVLVPITLFLIINSAVIVAHMVRVGGWQAHQLGITDHYANVGFLIALLEPLLIADLLGRLVRRKALLPMSGWASGTLLVLVVFSLIAAGARNGIIIILSAFLLGGGLMYSEMRKVFGVCKMIASLLVLILFVTGFGWLAYKSDSRWQNFAETVPIAWDIDRDLLWLRADGKGAPLTASGAPVEISAYNRIAWAHEGWRMLLAYPWGIEIARDTFHKLEEQKYGYVQMSHSHNAWLDMGLSIGFPGVLLWAAFLFLLGRDGWRAWRDYREPIGLALVILVIMFAARGMLDSIFRNHMIEQFMLVAGLLWALLPYLESQQEHV